MYQEFTEGHSFSHITNKADIVTCNMEFVVWPTTSCFADWSKRRHVTLRIIDCQEGVEYLQHVTSLARDML